RIVALRQVIVAPRHLSFRIISQKRHRHACSSWQLFAAYSVGLKLSDVTFCIGRAVDLTNAAADAGAVELFARAPTSLVGKSCSLASGPSQATRSFYA
ncbi:MAG TPA: hypothetical protein VGM50_07360, partial [Gemmatimonadaceae bacterium]